jgi:hypothetical protein
MEFDQQLNARSLLAIAEKAEKISSYLAEIVDLLREFISMRKSEIEEVAKTHELMRSLLCEVREETDVSERRKCCGNCGSDNVEIALAWNKDVGEERAHMVCLDCGRHAEWRTY